MNLNMISPLNQLGYGITGINLVKTLHSKCNLSLFPIKPIQIVTQQDADIIKQCIINSQKFDKDAACLKIWHQHDMAEFVGKGKHIGFTFFELDTFNESEKHHLNSLDKLFVTSEWAKKICEDQLSLSEENICVIPLGVDLSIFQPSFVPNEQKTVFFNCGKWEVRKGHDILYKVFNKAFTQDDEVELWMMCDNPFLNEKQTKEWHDLYKKSVLGDKIKLIPRVGTPSEVYNIMCQTDCGVFPSRAEGWNLELLEMMACGKKVIATNYSAHTEFCNSENCLLVDTEEREPAFDGMWFNGSGNWASITEKQEDQLCEYMQQIHKEKQQNKTLEINTSGILTAQVHDWNIISEKILQNV